MLFGEVCKVFREGVRVKLVFKDLDEEVISMGRISNYIGI